MLGLTRAFAFALVTMFASPADEVAPPTEPAPPRAVPEAAEPQPQPQPAPPADESASETVEVSLPPVLVIAADRGFMGNEELRDSVGEFVAATGARAQLVLLTGKSDDAKLRRALDHLASDSVVVLPLFISDDHPRFVEAKALLADVGAKWSAPFGESYFAVEILAERLRQIEKPKRHNTVLLSYGALTPEQRVAMQADLDRIAKHASAGLGLRRVRSLVWHEYDSPDEEERRKEVTREFAREMLRLGRTAVVPFNLGIKLDSMMSISGFVKRYLPRRSQYVGGDVLPHPAVAQWMQRELNRHRELTIDDLGVVFLAHGATFDWNETMRNAVEPLTAKYKVEFAFSMADRPVVEQAVRRLEARGASAIVVVRVFGLESSFVPTVDRMLGQDVEGGHHGHGMHHEHGGRSRRARGGHGHHGMNDGPRIRSTAHMVSVGGIEDDALFAGALLGRARALSRDPSRETVLVVAHGAGEDEDNDHWNRVLESLARQMKEQGGNDFRAIEIGTWREDWPKKRGPEIERIRGIVERGSANGRVLVIPARTTLEGPERKLLQGLEYELGSGFAPSPEFLRWVEDQVIEGAGRLGIQAGQ
ncbi:MAG: cobalamin biosynthesis protein CbiX [Myxococcota bacterium]